MEAGTPLAPAAPTRPTSAALPDSGDTFLQLVSALAESRSERLTAEQLRRLASLREPLRPLPADPWMRRYLECAERSFAGRPLSGGGRSAWLSAQRRAHAQGELAAGRVMLLECLNGFTWTPDADRWNAAIAQVRAFTVEHGRIPARGDDLALAAWLASQRLALRLGKLDADRTAALDDLPGWAESLAVERTRELWEARLAELRAFLERGGGCYPDPDSTVDAEVELARWVSRQRKCYGRSDLSGRRTDVLQDLPNWQWSARDASFDRRICTLRRELRGSAIPTSHRLYSWVAAQRSRHRDGRLTVEQVAALESLGLLNGGQPHNDAA